MSMSSSLSNNTFQIIYLGHILFLHRESCLIVWGELSQKWDALSHIMGQVVLVRVLTGASCLGASCLWSELTIINRNQYSICSCEWHYSDRQ